MEELALLFKIRDAITILIENGHPKFREYLDNVNQEIKEEMSRVNEQL